MVIDFFWYKVYQSLSSIWIKESYKPVWYPFLFFIFILFFYVNQNVKQNLQNKIKKQFPVNIIL